MSFYLPNPKVQRTGWEVIEYLDTLMPEFSVNPDPPLAPDEAPTPVDHANAGCVGAVPAPVWKYPNPFDCEESPMATLVRRANPEMMRWEPSPDVQSINALMTRLFEGWGDVAPMIDDAFIPPADLEETEGAYMIEVELPGVDKSDIDIALSGRRLTISGERKDRDREGVVRRRVRRMGEFRFEIMLPGDVDEDSISASLDSGLLNVTIAKRSGEKMRHVEIK